MAKNDLKFYITVVGMILVICVMIFLETNYCAVVQNDSSAYLTRREWNEWRQNFMQDTKNKFDELFTNKLDSKVGAYIDEFNKNNKPRVLVRNMKSRLASGSNIK